MKFNEKLQSLRKEHKMSQEQFADMLEVSRQAVSKWESGQTYPEMDKLISMCKIFKCTLDDLTNDEIKEINPQKEKKVMSSLLEEGVAMIQKTFSMFKSMNGNQIAHFIVEMGCLFLILLLVHIPVEYVYQLGDNIFENFGSNIGSLLSSIWYFILQILYILFSLFFFLYVYKVRYLDHFKIKEEKKGKVDDKEASFEKIVDEANPKDIIVEKKEKKEPQKKEHNYVIFSVISSLFSMFLKFCAICVGLPFLFILFSLFVILIIGIILLFQGIFFFGIILCTLAAILLTYLVLQILIAFLFHKNLSMKKFSIMLFTSIAILGVGSGIALFDIANIHYIDEVPGQKQVTKIEKTFLVKENTLLYPYWNSNNITYIVDESMGNNLRVEAAYYSDYTNIQFYEHDDFIDINVHNNDSLTFPDTFRFLLEDLKKKELRNYGLFYDVAITIHGTSESIQTIKKNQTTWEENRNQEVIRNYEQQINTLNRKIVQLENQISLLTEEKESIKDTYQQQLEEYKATIQEYKDKLNDILER